MLRIICKIFYNFFLVLFMKPGLCKYYQILYYWSHPKPKKYSLLFKNYFIIVCVFSLHICLCTMGMPVVQEEKKASEPLQLDLQGGCEPQMGVENWIQVLWKSSYCSQPLCHLSSLLYILKFHYLNFKLFINILFSVLT